MAFTAYYTIWTNSNEDMLLAHNKPTIFLNTDVDMSSFYFFLIYAVLAADAVSRPYFSCARLGSGPASEQHSSAVNLSVSLLRLDAVFLAFLP